MTIAHYILITVITYAGMEGVTWFVHKYVMHGFLWVLHEDHHQPRYQHVFEKNDAFFVIGAIPSIALFYFGVNPELNYKFFIGLGILFYGITYFMVHDVLIHQRFKWFKNTWWPKYFCKFICKLLNGSTSSICIVSLLYLLLTLLIDSQSIWLAKHLWGGLHHQCPS